MSQIGEMYDIDRYYSDFIADAVVFFKAEKVDKENFVVIQPAGRRSTVFRK